MGRLINDFLTTPIPTEVWHYTNMAGFGGILSSGRVWATEAHHTTDETEFVHARDVAAHYLDDWQPANKSMARAKQAAQETLAHAFDKGALAPSRTEIFVASFCAVDDLKSQWMEYADAGRGVSLSFDLRHVRPPVEIGNSVTFAPCLYAIEEKERMLADALSDWVNTVSELYEKTGSRKWAATHLRTWQIIYRVYGLPFDNAALLEGKAALLESSGREFREQLHQAITQTSFDLLRIASHCKDHSFHQEAEWRLALPHMKAKPMKHSEVLYRGPHQTIPYIAHNLFAKKLPIVRVKAGPLCENVDQIKALLTQHAYDVPVETFRRSHSSGSVDPALAIATRGICPIC
jgi:hypothetical protein